MNRLPSLKSGIQKGSGEVVAVLRTVANNGRIEGEFIATSEDLAAIGAVEDVDVIPDSQCERLGARARQASLSYDSVSRLSA